jgi:hypothetical protein
MDGTKAFPGSGRCEASWDTMDPAVLQVGSNAKDRSKPAGSSASENELRA